MEIKDIEEFSRKTNLKLQTYYKFTKPEQLNLPITIKIMEELGELCNDVLGHSGLQRKEKLEKLDLENIEEEFADVILTTFHLASNMNIDVEKALERKISKTKERFEM